MAALVSAFILDPAPSILDPDPPSILRPSPRAPAVASSSSSSQSRSTLADPPRKIRFAPLPDPRRPAPCDRDDSESDAAPRRPPPPAPAAPPSPAPSAHSLLDSDAPDDRPRSKPTKWRQKLLRPLLQPRSRPPPDDPPRVPAQPAPAPATVYNPGAPLARRTSTTALPTARDAARQNPFPDAPPPVWPERPPTLPAKPRKDPPRLLNGQRLLNGRVYGKRPSSADPTTRPSLDPEFVEWGYGGMGSVNNDSARGRNSSGLDWAKVQSRSRAFVEGGDAEGDDGSGMGWVRRRREQREQREREKREQDARGPAPAPPEIEVHPPKIPDEKPPQPDAPPEEPHIYRAVNVPAAHHRHHSKKGGETNGTVTPTSARTLSRTSSLASSRHGDLPLNPEHDAVNPSASGSSLDSLASKSFSESPVERDSEDEDDSGDEARITSKSAGVEKISRHKD